MRLEFQVFRQSNERRKDVLRELGPTGRDKPLCWCKTESDTCWKDIKLDRQRGHRTHCPESDNDRLKKRKKNKKLRTLKWWLKKFVSVHKQTNTIITLN